MNHYAGQRYGTTLMQAAEQLAKEKTVLLQQYAPWIGRLWIFYKKLGYRVEFERHVHLKNSCLLLS